MDMSGLIKFEILKKITISEFNSSLHQCSLKIAATRSHLVIFIMDNARIHKRVDEIDLASQHTVKYPPRYSLMFNPIEEIFNELKSFV